MPLSHYRLVMEAASYHRLQRVSDDPVANVRRGGHSALADAELQRFAVPTRGGR